MALRRSSPYVAIAVTDSDRALLEAIAKLTEQLGRPPAAGEIGEHLGITRLGARKRLKRAERRGLLQDVPKVVSSGKWALTRAGERARNGG